MPPRYHFQSLPDNKQKHKRKPKDKQSGETTKEAPHYCVISLSLINHSNPNTVKRTCT